MKAIYSLAFIFTFASFALGSGNENKNLKIAEAYYANGDYFKAAKYYSKAEKKGDLPTESYEHMATAYFKISDIKQAHTYFLKAEKRKNVHLEVEVLHAFALKRVGEYKKAQALLTHYLKNTKDSSVLQYIADCDSALQWRKPNPSVKVEVVNGINSFYSDMLPYFYNGKIIFSSAREEVLILDKAGTTGEPYYRLYATDMQGNNAGEITHFHAHEKRNHHISSFCYGNDENDVFYSTNLKIKKDSAYVHVSPLKIYNVKNINNEWQKPQIIFSNENDMHIYTHPFYSVSDSTLYFASNKPGGMGGMDIYYSRKISGNQWSEPVNAGAGINTKGNEVFPSYYDKTLYFSSDTRAGLGGYDIFRARKINDIFQDAENLKIPINTNFDDFGITFSDNTFTKGFFSSNRTESKGKDDIFAFSFSKKDSRIILLTGIAMDAVTGEHLANTIVNLKDSNGNDLGSTKTDKEGNYSLELEKSKKYGITGITNNYFDASESFNTMTENDHLEVNLLLDKKGSIKLKGLISDAESKQSIDKVYVTIVNNQKSNNTSSDNNGKFEQNIENQKVLKPINFSVKVEKEGYLSQVFDYAQKANENGEIEVECVMTKINIGTDIGKLVDVQTIYFDLDKSDIRPDAAKELDKIVSAMKNNPKLVIELGSHTDSRGDDDYNLKLSNDRAKSSVKYIISKGIDKDRIISKGYGETQLVNSCGNDAECTEEQHQENRRTEFKVVKY